MQRHLWLGQNGKGGSVPGAVPIIAVDAKNEHLAVHQPGTNHHIQVWYTRQLKLIDTVKDQIAEELVPRGETLVWQQLGFSLDGLKLLALSLSNCPILSVYTRTSAQSALRLLCATPIPLKGPAHAPSFFPNDTNVICCSGEEAPCCWSHSLPRGQCLAACCLELQSPEHTTL
jgi:hypothetical protein